MSMKCPECGSEDRFKIQGAAWIYVKGPAELPHCIEGLGDYNSESNASCQACWHGAKVGRFRLCAEQAKDKAKKDAKSAESCALVPKADYDDLKETYEGLQHTASHLGQENAELMAECVQLRKTVQVLSDKLNVVTPELNALKKLRARIQALV